jgi:hypothetical protein
LQIGETSVKHESWRFNFICALSASRGRVGERAAHLPRNAVHGAGANAEFVGNLVVTATCKQNTTMPNSIMVSRAVVAG